MPKIILASQSSARKRLLARLGASFQVESPDVDEERYKEGKKPPEDIVKALAAAKAVAVAKTHPRVIVIGSDQMLVSSRKIYGKPYDRKGAIRQLTELSGKRVALLTAVCVVIEGRKSIFIDRTYLTFRNLTQAQIDNYVRRDKPYGCAGSFMFESAGVGLFSKVETEDPTAIEGLPLIRLNNILRRLGASLPY